MLHNSCKIIKESRKVKRLLVVGSQFLRSRFSVVGCRLSVVSFRFSVVSCQLSVLISQLFVVGCQLSVLNFSVLSAQCGLRSSVFNHSVFRLLSPVFGLPSKFNLIKLYKSSLFILSTEWVKGKT
jgi:hypothetical protein